MQVDDATDRSETPEECDGCEEPAVPLTRHYSYGPGHNVTWHCVFCTNFLQPETATHRNLAAMGHIILRAIASI